MNKRYSRAYTEIIEIIKYLPQYEHDMIPKEKIEFYENNMDTTYNYQFNPYIPLENQEISMEANAIIVNIFKDYFATDIQKVKLEKILKSNDQKIDKELSQKYSYENLFKNKNQEEYKQKFQNENNQKENNSIIEYKKLNLFQNIFKKIKSILNKNK